MKQVKKFFGSTRGRVLLGVLMLTMFVCMLVATITMAAASRPTRSTTTSSYDLFRTACPFVANFVIDKPRIWVPASGGAEVTVGSLVGLGDGTPTPSEINTSEISGFTMANGHSFSALMPVPADIDLAKDIRLRAVWSNSQGAGTGSGQVVFVYEPFIVGTTAISVPNDACDTDGTTVVDLAASVLTYSTWSTIDGGTITLTPGDDFLIVKADHTLTTITNMTTYGIQMEYSRKWIGGAGSY